MKNRNSLIPLTLLTGAFLLPHSAQAHHAEFMAGNPFLQGLSMPAHGIDHLLSALAVGLIASRAPQDLRPKLLSLFALVALLGGFVNLSGVSLPEMAVPLTVLLSGVLLWKNISSPLVAAVLVATAGLVNGEALIEGAPMNFSPFTTALFASGCLISAGIFTGVGLLLGRFLHSNQTLTRIAAASIIAGAAIVASFPSLNSAVIRLIE